MVRVAVLLPALAPGCFYYDSTWGESKQAQKRAAKALYSQTLASAKA